MKSDASTRAKLHLVFTIVLLLLSMRLLFSAASVNICRELEDTHKRLLRELRLLRKTPSAYGHKMVRQVSSKLMSISRFSQAKSCRALRPNRRKLEFSIADSPLDGVLLYIVSVVGVRRKVIVHVDSSHAATSIGSYLARYYSWTLVTVCEKWTGYEATRKYFELDRQVSVLDTGELKGKLGKHLAREHIAGNFDVLVLFPQNGAELSLMASLDMELRPRILAMLYQDYWGKESRSRVGKGEMDVDGRDRLFTGGSLSAMVRVGERVGYRLVWCMRSIPVAIFVDANGGVGDGVLKTRKVKECIGNDIVWKRDAEAKWDLAQKYSWETVT